MKVKDKRFFAWILLIISLIACFVVLIVTVEMKVFEKVDKLTGMPRVDVTLADGLFLEEINKNSKDIKYKGNKMVITEGDEAVFYDDVEIKGRGNISWFEEKKPYRIKFKRKINLLGMGKFKKWAFLTYSLDDSLLRGDLGYYFARIIDEEYPLRGEFVHFFINNEDLGVYYVSPVIDIGKKMIDLRDNLGIIVELDNAWYPDDGYYRTKGGNYLVAKDVVFEENEEVALKEFSKSFEIFEDSIIRKDFELMKNTIDVDSLVDYYLFSEFLQNYDAYLTSFYFYKDGKNDKIHVGPVWDFDGIAGNKQWREGRDEGKASPTVMVTKWRLQDSKSGCDKKNDSTLQDVSKGDFGAMVCNLAKMSEFQDLVKEKYNLKIRGKKEAVLEFLKDEAEYIRDEAINNNKIWKKGSFDEAVDYLIWWIEERFNYFDEIYSDNLMDTEEY